MIGEMVEEGRRGILWAISSHCIARRNWEGNSMYLTITVPPFLFILLLDMSVFII